MMRISLRNEKFFLRKEREKKNPVYLILNVLYIDFFGSNEYDLSFIVKQSMLK